MTPHPTLLCITGRPGAGKSTLAAVLGMRIGWPVLHRDTFTSGMHALLPDGQIDHVRVNNAFFATVETVITNACSVIIDAAFQQPRWAAALTTLAPYAQPIIVRCELDAATARNRIQQRLHNDPTRAMHQDALFLARPLDNAWQSVVLNFPTLDCDMTQPTEQHIPAILAMLQ